MGVFRNENATAQHCRATQQQGKCSSCLGCARRSQVHAHCLSFAAKESHKFIRNFPESHGFHVVLSCDKVQVTVYDLNSKISAQSILPFEAPKRSGALLFLILPGTPEPFCGHPNPTRQKEASFRETIRDRVPFMVFWSVWAVAAVEASHRLTTCKG